MVVLRDPGRQIMIRSLLPLHRDACTVWTDLKEARLTSYTCKSSHRKRRLISKSNHNPKLIKDHFHRHPPNQTLVCEWCDKCLTDKGVI